ncbi:MAG: T9SS type A sorting domain-containing protein [Phycisphaerae bacterium]|nr:T9SS type A sorting domain-containing protein [Saprospiraceae bacterium]
MTASNLPVPSTLTWYHGTNIVATTIASASTATLDVTQPGDYSVVINDALCLASSSIVSIVRVGPDNPILSASDSVICVNGSIHLIASNLPVPSTLSWYNGATIVATTTVSATTSPLIVTEPGNYSVVINDTLCAPTSSVVSIVRIGPDNPILSANNLVLCPNDSIILTASNLAVPSLLNWYNGTSIIALTAATSTTETITVTEPGNYTVSILDPLCLTTSAIVTIVAESPLLPLIASNYDSLYALSSCSACQWLYQGQPIAGATGTYHIATEEGFYSLQVTSPNGCQYTSNKVNFIKVASKLPASVRRFLLSPNPTERSILLEMELEKAEHINVSLNDTNQRQIFAKTLDGQKIALPIDLSNLPVGTYFLTVQTESGSFVRKVVKK